MKSLLLLLSVLLWQTGISQLKGQTAIYKVAFSTGLQTDLAALGSGEGKDTSLTSRLQGSLQLVYIDTIKGKWYCYGFFPVIGQSSFPLPQKEQQGIREILQRGFYFTQYSTGKLDSLWLPPNVTEAAEHFIKQLLEYYQYYLPASPDTGWQTELLLTDGRVSATYSSATDGHKLQLKGLTPVYENGPTGMFVRSNEYIPDVYYVFDHRRLQAVKGAVIRKAKINHKTITTLTNIFEYTLQSSANAWPVSAGLLSRRIGLKGQAFYDPERAVQKLQENYAERSRQISVAGLLEQLRLNEERKDVNVQDKLSELVKICFITGKDSLLLLREAFMEADVNSIGFKTMRTGIITASTGYAQEIVRDYIVARKHDRNAMKKLLPSAGLVRAPTRSLQATLELLAFDSTLEEGTRTAALLALGNIAGSLWRSAAARADSLVQRLAVFTDRSGDDMLLLSVLGNAGTPAGLPYILPLLKEKDTVVKAYAYYALRFISQSMIDSLYRQALVHEQEEEVLINVLNALFLRPYTDSLATAVYEFIGQEHPEKTRLAALQVLFEWSYRRPVLLEKIRAIATGNFNPAVRKTALQFLARADE